MTASPVEVIADQKSIKGEYPAARGMTTSPMGVVADQKSIKGDVPRFAGHDDIARRINVTNWRASTPRRGA